MVDISNGMRQSWCDTIDTCMRRTVIGRANWVLWSRCWRIPPAPTRHKPRVHPKSYQELWKTWSEWRMCSKVSVQGHHVFSCSLKLNPKTSFVRACHNTFWIHFKFSEPVSHPNVILCYLNSWDHLTKYVQHHTMWFPMCAVFHLSSCFWSIVTSLWRTSYNGKGLDFQV
jgi:hypothetical protein